MENLTELVLEQKITYLGTIEGDQARVRPMGHFSLIDGKFTWCTNNTKEVYKQVLANPKIEFCMFAGGKTIRLSGTCLPTDSAEAKAEFLKLQPGVAKFYGGSEDILKIMQFQDATVSITAKGVKEATKLY